MIRRVESAQERLMKCTQCNTETEDREIEDMATPQPVCPQCNRIEFGYSEEESDLVLSLQSTFGVEKYAISSILFSVRKHIKVLSDD